MHWKPTDLWLEQANTIVLANEFMNSAPLVSFVPQQVLIFVCMFVHVYSVLSDSLWPVDCSPPGSSPWDFPGKYSRVDCHFLLQEIFPTQKSNLHFLHWEMDSFPLSHLALFEPQRYQKPPHQLLHSCCICLPPSRKWPHLASSPSARLDTLYLVLNVLGFTSLPPHEIIMGKKSNKPITSSQGNQASLHLITNLCLRGHLFFLGLWMLRWLVHNKATPFRSSVNKCDPNCPQWDWDTPLVNYPAFVELEGTYQEAFMIQALLPFSNFLAYERVQMRLWSRTSP